MRNVLWIALLVELAVVPTIDKDAEGSPKRMDAAGKTARAAGQTSQVVAKLGIVGLNRIGLAFVRHHPVLSGVVIQAGVKGKGITEEETGLRRLVHHFLHQVFAALWLNRPIHNAVGFSVYVREDEDLVFFSPMKVKTSSISRMSTVSGCGAAGSCAA